MTDVDVQDPAAEDLAVAEGEQTNEPDEVDWTNGRGSPIVETLRELGPATAREIAQRLGRDTANVSTQLRRYEDQAKVRRTGRSTAEPGQRGGPSIEWEVMPEGDDGTSVAGRTGPGDVISAPSGANEDRIRERVRALAAQVERLSRDLERAENERDAARLRASDAESTAALLEARVTQLQAEQAAPLVQPADDERHAQIAAALERARTELTAAGERIAQLEVDVDGRIEALERERDAAVEAAAVEVEAANGRATRVGPGMVVLPWATVEFLRDLGLGGIGVADLDPTDLRHLLVLAEAQEHMTPVEAQPNEETR